MFYIKFLPRFCLDYLTYDSVTECTNQNTPLTESVTYMVQWGVFFGVGGFYINIESNISLK